VSKKGFKLISADYSQIELRIIAHLSNDESMINSFLNHEDIHTRTAAEVNEVSLDKVTYEMRSAAKATNFGIVYGIGAHGLSEQLGWTHEEAKKYINKYHKKHPRLIAFLKETIEKTKKYGYAETLLGRKRYIPEINSSNFQVRASGERMAINFPAQGTAADFIKKAMINIAEKINSVSPESKMILQVHDELVFETPKNDVIEMASFIEKNMENVYKNLAVPIQVDISYGNNWKEMKNIVKGDKNKVKGFQH
jgi:DNA polymerase-1